MVDSTAGLAASGGGTNTYPRGSRDVAPGARWGVLGTANIAARTFLPALRAAGGTAAVVGSRDSARARSWALDNQVSGVSDYAGVLADDTIDAVYIALPNSLHVEWAERAAAAGKAVLCEKPLGRSPGEVSGLAARLPDHERIWEAFVFPFHPQSELVVRLIADGKLGEVTQIDSEFHFQLTRRTNIRWRADLGGGALLDVGCYPIRLARMIFGSEPVRAVASATFDTPDRRGVDAETAGILDFDERRLLFSCGMRRPASTYTRIIGSAAELRISNPFHPTPDDGVELWQCGDQVQRWQSSDGSAFEHAIRHVHAVLAGVASPRHTINPESVGQAAAIGLVQDALRRSQEPA